MIFQRCPNINIFYQTVGVSKSCLNVLEELSVLSKVTRKSMSQQSTELASSKKSIPNTDCVLCAAYLTVTWPLCEYKPESSPLITFEPVCLYKVG